MTELILIRHGETLWNQQARMQGQQDSPLTELGVRQARQLGRRLRELRFDALYSSDLGRAYRTALDISEQTGHEIAVDERLRERHFGVFEGLTSADIQARYPEDYARFASRDPDYAMSGGETARAFHERCLGCLEEIASRHSRAAAVVVTHGLVLDALYRAALGMRLDEPRGFPLLNCSLNTFHYRGGRWKAMAVCDVAHLEADAVTRYDGRVV
jgi:probable phosphoglycerate mutase